MLDNIFLQATGSCPTCFTSICLQNEEEDMDQVYSEDMVKEAAGALYVGSCTSIFCWWNVLDWWVDSSWG